MLPEIVNFAEEVFMSIASYYASALDVCKQVRAIAGGSQESGSCFYLHKLMHTTYYRTLWCFPDTKPAAMAVEEYDIESGDMTYRVDLQELISR